MMYDPVCSWGVIQNISAHDSFLVHNANSQKILPINSGDIKYLYSEKYRYDLLFI
jgi:hypothetical protein